MDNVFGQAPDSSDAWGQGHYTCLFPILDTCAHQGYIRGIFILSDSLGSKCEFQTKN